MIHHLLPALLLVMSSLRIAAQYNGPESVEYDAVGDRYFVSNTGSSQIRVRSQAGTVTTFASVSPAPYGLEIMGDTLFACSGGGVKGFLLATGAQVFNRSLGGTFCNGITTDGRYLYVTDFSGGRIYKVDVANSSHSTLVASTGGSPNGIVWDPVGERLVVVFWGTNAPIRSYDRQTGAATTLLANSGLGNIDGVTIDCNGNFITANWTPARISRWAPNFQGGAVNLNVSGLGNPADIDFDPVNDRICIPNSGNNTVLLVDVNCSTGLEEPLPALLRLHPNPAMDGLRLEPPLKQRAAFLLIDQRGRIAASGLLEPGAMLDVATLAPGLYTLSIPAEGVQLRFLRAEQR
jgi:DNA-binding beta-propeller fold protein YncE